MSDFENIPAELQDRDQWLFWNGSNDTPRAPLDSPTASYGCSWSDPDTWTSFDKVADAADGVEQAGIGFVNAVDNDDYARGIVGSIDIDGVVDEEGGPKDWLPSLQPFFDNDAYVEYSPSDTGLRIPIVGLDVPEWWADQHFSAEEHEGVEVLTNKFSTYTGNKLDGAGDEPAEYGDWLDEWLVEAYKAVTGDDPLADADVEGAEAPDNSSARRSRQTDEEWVTEEVAEEALSHINPNVSYDVWKDIGMALANHFGTSTGQSLFEQWSRGGSKWDSEAQSQAERIINDASGYNYEVGTLIHHASNNGWDASQAAKEAVKPRSDGGATTADASPATGVQTLQERVSDIIVTAEAEDIQHKTARHRIANAFTDEYDFVYPEEEVRGWREVLYVYEGEEGVYEPRAEAFVERELERVAGDYVTNQVRNEIVEKIKRMSIARGERFEVAPNRLVVANGILDLYTGDLEPWTSRELHRTKIDVRWNPDAGEPTAIDDFLSEIVDDSDVTTLYRLVAHTLMKEYVGEKAAILIGSGQNGKSVFLDLVEHFIQGFNVTHQELQDFSRNDFAANNLQGKLANLATEIGEQEVEDTTTFKKLTGRDTIDANVKFEKPIKFENFATLMFATNEMPVFGQDNHAVWRRWVFVDFPYTFDAHDPGAKDPEPKDVLIRRLTDDSELEALLLRCQQEIQRWHEDSDEQFFADAMPPQQVRDKMKKAAEPVYNFASTCLDVGDEEDTWVEKSVVRAAYRAYADEEDLPTMAENTFGEQLVMLRDFAIEPGQRRVDGSVSRVYNGIELSSRGRQVLGVDDPDGDQGQIDDGPQATAVVMDQLRAMVEENDSQPVPYEGVVWRCSGQIGKATAEQALDEILQTGRAMDDSDGVIPTDI